MREQKKVSSRPQSFPKQGDNEAGLAQACSTSYNASKLSNARSIINFEVLELEISPLEVKPNLKKFSKINVLSNFPWWILDFETCSVLRALDGGD